MSFARASGGVEKIYPALPAGPSVAHKTGTSGTMVAAGRSSGLVIQAFRYPGPEHVTPERIARLRRTLPADDRRGLLKDLTVAPTTMHRTLKELAAS